MAGDKRTKGSSHKPPSSSHREKSSREPGDPKPSDAGDSKQNLSKATPSSARKDKPPTPKSKLLLTPSPGHPKPPSEPGPPFGAPFLLPDGMGPPPPPAYGFHMLERRTIVLADGSVRSYFALPPDYQNFTPLPRPIFPRGEELSGTGVGFDRHFHAGGPMSPEFRERGDPYMRGRNQDNWNPLGLDGRNGIESSLKRKFGDEGERSRREEKEGKDEFARQRQQLLQYGSVGSNPNGYLNDFKAGTSSSYRRDVVNIGGGDEMRAAKYMRTGDVYESSLGTVGLKHNAVDQSALKKAFLHFSKLVNESVSRRKNYLADGKQGPLQCVVCGRSSRDFPDMHALIVHTYNSDSGNLLVDHLGLHKALCVLMGWNYAKPPDNAKSYQCLSANEAISNQEDLVLWPPAVIIHNTITGKGRDGRMEGLGNKAMDSKIRDLGFGGGKAKSVFGREGHLGITMVRFAGDESGLKEAMRLAEYFEKDNHGRKAWAHVQSLVSGNNDEDNPLLVKVDGRTGEKTRIFYGYLATVSDLDKVDFETRKKVMIESRREFKASK